jgi:hypothetical protein
MASAPLWLVLLSNNAMLSCSRAEAAESSELCS